MLVIYILILLLILILLFCYNFKQKEFFKQQKYRNKLNNKNIRSTESTGLKCIVYCNYNDIDFINYLVNTSQYSFIITHLHIMVSLADVPMNINLSTTKVPSFILNDVSGSTQGLIIPIIQQIQYLESQVLEQLQTLQNNNVKLILAIQPGANGYYGFRTIPNDISQFQATSPENPVSNIPVYNCPTKYESSALSLQLAYNLVECFFTAGLYRPAVLQYDGADILDYNYYCATEYDSPCNYNTSCNPPAGSYSVYNVLQFMRNLQVAGTLINPNFTLSKGLMNDCDLTSNIKICDPTAINGNTLTDISLGIINYGSSLYIYNDPYGNFYSTIISPQQMNLSLDFSQESSQQNYQTFMQYIIQHGYGGITLFSLSCCNPVNSSICTESCSINIDTILQTWNNLLCTNNSNPYYSLGKCNECINNTDCSNTAVSYCYQGNCSQCITNYDCYQQNPTQPFCIAGSCSSCLSGYSGLDCICSLEDISNCNCNITNTTYNNSINYCMTNQKSFQGIANPISASIIVFSIINGIVNVYVYTNPIYPTIYSVNLTYNGVNDRATSCNMISSSQCYVIGTYQFYELSLNSEQNQIIITNSIPFSNTDGISLSTIVGNNIFCVYNNQRTTLSVGTIGSSSFNNVAELPNKILMLKSQNGYVYGYYSVTDSSNAIFIYSTITNSMITTSLFMFSADVYVSDSLFTVINNQFIYANPTYDNISPCLQYYNLTTSGTGSLGCFTTNIVAVNSITMLGYEYFIYLDQSGNLTLLNNTQGVYIQIGSGLTEYTTITCIPNIYSIILSNISTNKLWSTNYFLCSNEFQWNDYEAAGTFIIYDNTNNYINVFQVVRDNTASTTLVGQVFSYIYNNQGALQTSFALSNAASYITSSSDSTYYFCGALDIYDVSWSGITDNNWGSYTSSKLTNIKLPLGAVSPAQSTFYDIGNNIIYYCVNNVDLDMWYNLYYNNISTGTLSNKMLPGPIFYVTGNTDYVYGYYSSGNNSYAYLFAASLSSTGPQNLVTDILYSYSTLPAMYKATIIQDSLIYIDPTNNGNLIIYDLSTGEPSNLQPNGNTNININSVDSIISNDNAYLIVFYSSGDIYVRNLSTTTTNILLSNSGSEGYIKCIVGSDNLAYINGFYINIIPNQFS